MGQGSRRRWAALGARLVEEAVDAVVGRRCGGCDVEVERGIFCALCAVAVVETPGPVAEGLFAAAVLGGPLPDAIHRLKYRDRPDLARPLGALLLRGLPPALAVDGVVPVPLHPWRLADRGYNQAGLLAKRVARLGGWPTLLTGLRRIRETPSQTTLGRAERLTSLAGAFVGSRALVGRRILLVDDVTTTGATLRTCAAAAREAGAQSVVMAAVAATSD